MSASQAEIAAAYAECERVMVTAAKNFSYGIRLLAPDKRGALAAVYALARRIDDIGDGEAIEKALRKELEGRIDFTKLDQGLVFGLDVRSVTANQGTVDLIVGRAAGVGLSAQEQAQIQAAFQRAIVKFNQGAAGYTRGSAMTSGSFRFVPGPGVLGFSDQGQ